jgi:hypothetical protein
MSTRHTSILVALMSVDIVIVTVGIRIRIRVSMVTCLVLSGEFSRPVSAGPRASA